jgi:hypothetical protein
MASLAVITRLAGPAPTGVPGDVHGGRSVRAVATIEVR